MGSTVTFHLAELESAAEARSLDARDYGPITPLLNDDSISEVIVNGSGKTTTLNVLSAFIPDTERVVTIEDAAELQLRQPHKVRLESRPARIDGSGRISIRDLVVNALRMRPDRIVIGECRSGEALD